PPQGRIPRTQDPQRRQPRSPQIHLGRNNRPRTRPRRRPRRRPQLPARRTRPPRQGQRRQTPPLPAHRARPRPPAPPRLTVVTIFFVTTAMPTPSAAKHDSALRREIIAYWVEVATAFGFQRSWGEIYGLIFASEQPLCADDITATLDMSRSGVGQGLKALLEIGAIRPAHQLGSRKDHYQLQPDLGVLVKQLL